MTWQCSRCRYSRPQPEGRCRRPSITRRLVARFGAQLMTPQPCVELERLTGRETEVLQLMAGGLSNVEIADELYLSAMTVKSHVAGILAKLGCRDRVQALVFAYEHAVVHPHRVSKPHRWPTGHRGPAHERSRHRRWRPGSPGYRSLAPATGLSRHAVCP